LCEPHPQHDARIAPRSIKRRQLSEVVDHALDPGTGDRAQGYEPPQARPVPREEQRLRERAQGAERLEHDRRLQASRGRGRPHDETRDRQAKEKSVGFADNIPAFLRRPARAGT
jgi:hypothetical protein